MSAGELTGRTVVLTGAAGTIGQAIRTTMTAHGATVVGLDLHANDGCLACDVTDVEQMHRVVSKLAENQELTDCIHAAGAMAVGGVLDVSIEDVRRVVDTNLISNFVVAQTVIPRLSAPSSFVVLASQASFQGSGDWSAYCASKAGALSFVQSFSQEVGKDGIRVNAVCPASVDSPMMDAAITRLASIRSVPESQLRDAYVTANPLGRMAAPADVANACLFLLSPASGFISGTSITVDGGEGPG